MSKMKTVRIPMDRDAWLLAGGPCPSCGTPMVGAQVLDHDADLNECESCGIQLMWTGFDTDNGVVLPEIRVFRDVHGHEQVRDGYISRTGQEPE